MVTTVGTVAGGPGTTGGLPLVDGPGGVPLEVAVLALPMRTRFRGITRRQGVLLGGPGGWGEFCPFEDYDDAQSVPWLLAALEACAGDWPAAVRDTVPVNCTVPAVDGEQAHEIVSASGCSTAKVKVAESS